VGECNFFSWASWDHIRNLSPFFWCSHHHLSHTHKIDLTRISVLVGLFIAFDATCSMLLLKSRYLMETCLFWAYRQSKCWGAAWCCSPHMGICRTAFHIERCLLTKHRLYCHRLSHWGLPGPCKGENLVRFGWGHQSFLVFCRIQNQLASKFQIWRRCYWV
jgi:hypothetical protein